MTDVSIDVASPLQDCFLHCEVECVRECCGIDAISTDSALIAEWARTAGAASAAEAHQQLGELIAVVADRSHKVSSAFLNHYTSDEEARKQLLDFLDKFRSALSTIA
jgi:hypothetical protein